MFGQLPTDQPSMASLLGQPASSQPAFGQLAFGQPFQGAPIFGGFEDEPLGRSNTQIPQHRKIDSLPPELLSVIFLATMPHYDWRRNIPFNREGSRDPLLLVCRGWRDVVESTPEMWSVIYIDPRSKPGAIRRLVEMAKSSTLDIHISKNSTFPMGNADVTFKAAVAVAARKADQWGTLVLNGYFPDVRELYEWIPHSLPGLHSAMIRIRLESSPNAWVPCISAPKLRTLIVRGDSQFAFAECSELRDLELVDLSEYWGNPDANPDVVWADNAQSYFAWLASACPYLERLTFGFRNLTIPTHDPTEDVPNRPESSWPCFPRLQLISFNDPTLSIIDYFLQHLRTSNPLTLEFNGVDCTAQPPSRRLHISPSCRFLRLYNQSLHDIRLFLSNFSDLSGALVEVADTTAALGFTTEVDHSPIWLRPASNTVEQMERAERIKEDWRWVSSSTRVRWYFPQSDLNEGVEGIGVGKGMVYACQALISESSKSWLNGNPNMGTRPQAEVILSILLDVCS